MMKIRNKKGIIYICIVLVLLFRILFDETGRVDGIDTQITAERRNEAGRLVRRDIVRDEAYIENVHGTEWVMGNLSKLRKSITEQAGDISLTVIKNPQKGREQRAERETENDTHSQMVIVHFLHQKDGMKGKSLL